MTTCTGSPEPHEIDHCDEAAALSDGDDFEDVPDLDLADVMRVMSPGYSIERRNSGSVSGEPAISPDVEETDGDLASPPTSPQNDVITNSMPASTAPTECPASTSNADGAGAYAECERLLQLFGVPFVRAPAEAEAQCAELERLGLVGACVTDDSDALLFGARTIYRWLFNKQRHVQCYRSQRIHAVLGISRLQLIQLAVLSGCDYTRGVRGVGCVAGLEVLAEFSHGGRDGGDDAAYTEERRKCAQAAIEPLLRFKQWWTEKKQKGDGAGAENPTRARLSKLRLQFPPSWPDAAVYSAFRWPLVDHSTERFTLGQPDVDGLVPIPQIEK